MKPYSYFSEILVFVILFRLQENHDDDKGKSTSIEETVSAHMKGFLDIIIWLLPWSYTCVASLCCFLFLFAYGYDMQLSEDVEAANADGESGIHLFLGAFLVLEFTITYPFFLYKI